MREVVLRNRGAWVWLAAVTVAITLVVGVDAWTATSTARGAEALSTSALRSAELAEDMRWQLTRIGLGRPSAVPDRGTEVQALVWLRRDVAAYEPLATFEGERPEWTTLSRITQRLAEYLERGDDANASRDAASARESVDRLIALNREEAGVIESRLSGLGRKQLVLDGLAGIVVVLALARLARLHVSALERERAAIAASLEVMTGKNRDLEAFAARVAHDLRAPLTPVQALAGLLAKGGQTGAEVQRLSGRIVGAASRMSDVIEAMLTFSRSGAVPAGTCGLRSVLQDVLDDLGTEHASVDLRVDVPDVRLGCAPEVLAQILRNLVGNGLKYRADDRRCQLGVNGRVDGPEVMVAVTDNGVGMDREAVRRAFEPFFRARSDRAGHGLGLAIVDRYVQALGGSIRLTSELDVGTRVELRLPRVRSLPGDGPSVTRESLLPGAASPSDAPGIEASRAGLA
jgi:signal transduction histidine kinase